MSHVRGTSLVTPNPTYISEAVEPTIVTKKIWTPESFALASATVFTASEIEAFERDILSNPTATEHDASRFFQRLPKFLHLGVGVEIRHEVILPGTGRTRRVDFFRRSYGEYFFHVIELKSPRQKLVVWDGGMTHPRLSCYVDKAINQGLNYRDLIMMDPAVRDALMQKGIPVCHPQILVIVGQSQEVDAETLHKLYDRVRHRGPVDCRSYTDIYAFAKEHYQRNKTLIIPALHFVHPQSPQDQPGLQPPAERVDRGPQSLHKLTPQLFELRIAELLKDFGQDVEVIPATRDGGRDFVVYSKAGSVLYAVQAKRYRARKVGDL